MKKVIKKAQNGAKTKDSTDYFKGKASKASLKYGLASGLPAMKAYEKEENAATQDKNRQKLKGKPGYDKNGYPIKKK